MEDSVESNVENGVRLVKLRREAKPLLMLKEVKFWLYQENWCWPARVEESAVINKTTSSMS